MRIAPSGTRSRWLAVLGTAAGVAGGIWVLYGSSRILFLLWGTRDSIFGRTLAGVWYLSLVGFCVSIFVFAIIPWAEPDPPTQPGGLKALLLGPRPLDRATGRLWFRLRIILGFFVASVIAMLLFAVADWTGLTR